MAKSKDDISKKEFSNKMKLLIKHLNLDIENLKEKLGVTKRTIKKWINGKSKPNDKNFQNLVSLVDVKKEFFYKDADYFIKELFILNNLNKENKIADESLKEIIKLSNDFKEKDKQSNDLEELLNDIIIEKETLNNEWAKFKREIVNIEDEMLKSFKRKEEEINKEFEELKEIKRDIVAEQEKILDYYNKSLWGKIKCFFVGPKIKQDDIPILKRQNE